MEFYYQAVSKAGEKREGKIKAEDKGQVVRKLKTRNYYIICIEAASKFSFSNWLPKLNRVSSQELALFSRQFATLLAAGLSLVATLSILAEEMTNQRLKEVLVKVEQEVQAGKSLAQVLAKHDAVFPPLMINLIAIGEEEGILEQVLEQLATYFEARTELIHKLRSTLVYPVFILLTSLAVIIFLVTFILPNFRNLFADYNLQLPWVTRYLLQAVEIIQQQWVWLLGAGGVLVSGLIIYFRSESGRWRFDYLLLSCPGLGRILLLVSLIHLTQVLGFMLQGGSDLLVGLRQLKGVITNQVVKEKITRVHTKVEQGQSFSQLLAREEIFPELLVQMVKVGEKTGRLDKMLLQVADYYQEKLEYDLEVLVSLVEPTTILLLSGVVLLIITSVMLPLFNLVNGI
ncbi:type II secretion system F family protein [Halanaerobaculum tunisiense]